MATTDSSQQQQGANGPEKASPLRFVKAHWPWFVLGGLVLLAAVVAYWWFFMHGLVKTDDAYVHADVASISSRIPGTVSDVLVDHDQRVEKGQLLVQLDQTDYRIAADEAAAVVARREADVKATAVNIDLIDKETAARIQSAQATLQKDVNQKQTIYHQIQELEKNRQAAQADLDFARKEYRRYEALYKQGRLASEAKRDETRTAFEKARANVKALDAHIEALKSSLQAAEDEIHQATADLDLAQSQRDNIAIERHRLESLKAQAAEERANLEQARMNLSYCTIKAPIAGQVAQKDIQVGDRVQPSQPFMAIVPLHRIYVRANYKETDLEHIRVGQPAKIKADSYPGYVYHGKVASIAAGSGAAFALLPPENASGNWIKIVRRVPVKIELDGVPSSDHPLRVGLSLEVTIDTRKH
jgi:membrane fusion protein (multidrug efflux system)